MPGLSGISSVHSESAENIRAISAEGNSKPEPAGNIALRGARREFAAMAPCFGR